MAPISTLSHLLNPLATSLQLETSSSQLDGLPRHLEDSVRYETARLLQSAGILLRLPQEVIAQAIVLLQRFYLGPDGGSLLEHDAKDVAPAALYLAAKLSAHPATPRQVLTSFEYLTSLRPENLAATAIDSGFETEWQLTEGNYEIAKNKLYEIEAHILRVLGFQTHVALPHTLCINYLQTLDAFQSKAGTTVTKAAFRHLNSALLSPQQIYLTHQPSAIATAAIYLAARETGVKLPETAWWEVFDVDREELGFLVVALRSIEGFASEEKRKWARRKVPMTIENLQAEIERSRMLEAGE